MVYPLGWSVIEQCTVKRERWPGAYRGKGVPLVYRGQEVVPDQPVLYVQYEKQDAPLLESGAQSPEPTDASTWSALTPHRANESAPGPENVPAGLHGRVVSFTPRGGVVIESRAAFVQGAVGTGTQVAGVLTLWQGSSVDFVPQTIPPGAILVVPGPLTFLLLRQAINSGVVGVVASSIELRDLEGFLRTDYLQLLSTSALERTQSHLPKLTLLFTEGIGSFAMSEHILALFRRYQGSIALLSGTTSTRYAISPDLVISLPLNETEQNWHPQRPDPTLSLGVQVRVHSGKDAGTIGRIEHFFMHEQIFPSGIRARAVNLRLENGSSRVVPLALVERIGA